MSQQPGSQGVPLPPGQFTTGRSSETVPRPYAFGGAGAQLFMNDPFAQQPAGLLSARDFAGGQFPPSLLQSHHVHHHPSAHRGIVSDMTPESVEPTTHHPYFSGSSQAPDSTSDSSTIRQQRRQDSMLPGNVTIKQEAGVSSPMFPSSNGLGNKPLQFNQLTSTGVQPPGNVGEPGMYAGLSNMQMAKHICAVCGDRASGKHYGVYSCEGCKGFFKRTVRKDLSYTCRDNEDCVIDKRQRNRCQHCRYQKCLNMGMKREAVQEERQKNKEKEESEVPNPNDDMPVDKILDAELASEPKVEQIVPFEQAQEQTNPAANICKKADRQLVTLVEWAKRIPHFSSLQLDDQVSLLRAGWNELLIASFSHRSINVKDSILLASGLHVHRHSAHQAGVGPIFDRVLTELVSKMRDMMMDKTELGCLRAIVLFNPDVKSLSDPANIESLREKVYASLEAYCRSKYPDQPGRFAKLLLRLPALRSIGLKCLEHLFFFKLIGDTPIDKFLMDLLEATVPESMVASGFLSPDMSHDLSSPT